MSVQEAGKKVCQCAFEVHAKTSISYHQRPTMTDDCPQKDNVEEKNTSVNVLEKERRSWLKQHIENDRNDKDVVEKKEGEKWHPKVIVVG